VRPLRQERQVQRNKAIIMLILAAMLVYGVINLIF
jgi:predicted nucleic acid-binding Zn ribbon protein